MVEPVTTSVLSGISVLKFLDAVVQDPWLRYFFVLGCLIIDNIVGQILGLYTIEGLFSFIISLFIPGFFFPIFYGISSLVILWGFCYPIASYLIKSSVYG